MTVPDPPAQAGDSARSTVPHNGAAGAVRLAFVPPEGRAVAALASIYATRMLGLFLVLPVLALYVRSLPGASPFLVGCAMGGYGLTQASLQIPLARLSDRVGRKPLFDFTVAERIGILVQTDIHVDLMEPKNLQNPSTTLPGRRWSESIRGCGMSS